MTRFSRSTTAIVNISSWRDQDGNIKNLTCTIANAENERSKNTVETTVGMFSCGAKYSFQRDSRRWFIEAICDDRALVEPSWTRGLACNVSMSVFVYKCPKTLRTEATIVYPIHHESTLSHSRSSITCLTCSTGLTLKNVHHHHSSLCYLFLHLHHPHHRKTPSHTLIPTNSRHRSASPSPSSPLSQSINLTPRPTVHPPEPKALARTTASPPPLQRHFHHAYRRPRRHRLSQRAELL